MEPMFRQAPIPVPSPRLVRRIDGLSVRAVALTFDDGPHPVHTPRLLDLLREAGAAATFFVVGREAERHPGLIKRIVGEGHQLGNHSWSHPHETTPEGATDELGRTHNLLKAITGMDTTLFRPPYGREHGALAVEAMSRGYRTVMWSMDTNDWRVRDSSRLSEMVGERTKRGDIVLMHDIHGSTVDAVPDLLRRLANRGVRCVSVERLLDPGRAFVSPTVRR